MDLTYNMDVDQDSKWIMITSNKDAKELLFYVSEIGHFRAGQKFFTERSGKEEYYIIFTVSGRGVMMHKGKEISLEKNNAVLIYCHDYQYYATASSEPWEHYWVHFNGKGAKNYYNIINENTILSVHIKEAEGFLANMEGIMRNSGVNDIRQSVMSSMYITNMLTMMVMGKYSIDNVKSTYTASDAEADDQASYAKIMRSQLRSTILPRSPIFPSIILSSCSNNLPE